MNLEHLFRIFFLGIFADLLKNLKHLIKWKYDQNYPGTVLETLSIIIFWLIVIPQSTGETLHP